MTLDLFSALPVQHPPTILYADEHTLETCIRCGGAGRDPEDAAMARPIEIEGIGILKCPQDEIEYWQERRCEPCAGVGMILRRTGQVRDV